MGEFPSVTDEQLEFTPIKILCDLSHQVPFQEKYNYAKIRLVLHTARLTAGDICMMDVRHDLLVDPLIRANLLPQDFIFFEDKEDSQEQDTLPANRLLDLMHTFRIGSLDITIPRSVDSLGNRDIVRWLTPIVSEKESEFYREQHILNGKDSHGVALVVYSWPTALKGARLNIGMSETEEYSPELDLEYVKIRVSSLTYDLDKSLRTTSF